MNTDSPNPRSFFSLRQAVVNMNTYVKTEEESVGPRRHMNVSYYTTSKWEWTGACASSLRTLNTWCYDRRVLTSTKHSTPLNAHCPKC